MANRWSNAKANRKPRQTLANHRARVNRHVRTKTGRNVRSRLAAREEQAAFSPPEDWHEPTKSGTADYKIVVKPAGEGYEHIVTPEEVRARLAKLPPEMLKPLEVVQLARMTKKKENFPCYGMQWGAALYLYPMEVGPMEDGIVECFAAPPSPLFQTEVRMYGGRFQQYGDYWELEWTEAAIKDFYLNNILIHELGHLLDDRNRSYTDRERYAEWFAIEYGYKASREEMARKAAKKLVRRRHKTY